MPSKKNQMLGFEIQAQTVSNPSIGTNLKTTWHFLLLDRSHRCEWLLTTARGLFAGLQVTFSPLFPFSGQLTPHPPFWTCLDPRLLLPPTLFCPKSEVHTGSPSLHSEWKSLLWVEPRRTIGQHHHHQDCICVFVFVYLYFCICSNVENLEIKIVSQVQKNNRSVSSPPRL